MDERVHSLECTRFDRFVVTGPAPADCAIWVGAVGKDGYGRFFIYRDGRGLCVRPNRYALARASEEPLGADVYALHECDTPLCVKVREEAPWHVVPGTQSDNMRRMARMRRGAPTVGGDGLAGRRAKSLALRAGLRTHGWDAAAVEAARLGSDWTLW